MNSLQVLGIAFSTGLLPLFQATPQAQMQTQASRPKLHSAFLRLSWLPNELERNRQLAALVGELTVYRGTRRFQRFLALHAPSENRTLESIWSWSNGALRSTPDEGDALWSVSAEHFLAAIELQKAARDDKSNALLANYLVYRAAQRMVTAQLQGDAQKRVATLAARFYSTFLLSHLGAIPPVGQGETNIPWENLDRADILRGAALAYRLAGQVTLCGFALQSAIAHYEARDDLLEADRSRLLLAMLLLSEKQRLEAFEVLLDIRSPALEREARDWMAQLEKEAPK